MMKSARKPGRYLGICQIHLNRPSFLTGFPFLYFFCYQKLLYNTKIVYTPKASIPPGIETPPDSPSSPALRGGKREALGGSRYRGLSLRYAPALRLRPEAPAHWRARGPAGICHSPYPLGVPLHSREILWQRPPPHPH